MPKLRRLNGKQVIDIFALFGFDVIRITGSHHRLKRIQDDEEQLLSVPVHASKTLPPGLLKSLYRQGSAFISDEELRKHFYTD